MCVDKPLSRIEPKLHPFITFSLGSLDFLDLRHLIEKIFKKNKFSLFPLTKTFFPGKKMTPCLDSSLAVILVVLATVCTAAPEADLVVAVPGLHPQPHYK